jgi:hypothetical protein
VFNLKENNMKTTITAYEAAHLLLQDENANWSYNGALALCEWLEEIEEDTGTETEFDRVAIRCEFSEYGSVLECAENYADPDYTDCEDDDEKEAVALEYLQDNTMVIQFDGGIIIQDF